MMPPTAGPELLAALAFRGWLPLWAATLLAVGGAVVAVLFYRREAGRVPLLQRGVLASLRVLILGAVVFLALRPTLVREVKSERPRPVALLVDNSQSMTQAEPRAAFLDRWRLGVAFGSIEPTRPLPAMPSAGDLPDDGPERPRRLDVARAALSNPKLDLLNRLAAVGPVQPATFGVRRSAQDPRSAAWLDALTGSEPKTALADALADLLKRDPSELPAAVVVVSDGRENASELSLDEVARQCRERKVPVHVYGVGSSSLGLVQLRDAPAPETLFVDDTVSVPIRYRLSGVTDGKVRLRLKLNGQEVAQKVVEAREGDDLKEVLSFVPQARDAQAGRQELTAAVEVLTSGEPISDELGKSVQVVDRKMKVLVVESLPRWDFKFLQRALLRDRRVEASFVLTDGDPKAMKAGPPFLPRFPATRAELFAFDLLILGDVPAAFFSPDQQKFVRQFVAEGGGLVQVAGRFHAPASYAGTPLADPLPVEFAAETFAADDPAANRAFRPAPTPAGARGPMLALGDDAAESLRTWRTLPEMYWFYPIQRLKPAAEALLTHPTRTAEGGGPMPLLASHTYGKGFCLFVGFDETWRWRLNAAEKLFGRFWSQVVYAAGVSRTLGTKVTQLSLDPAEPQLGKSGQVYARLLTPDLQPRVSDRIEARLERLDGPAGEAGRTQTIELKALPGREGEYVATLPFNRAGRFALRVDNADDPASLEYRVALPPDHELAPGALAEDALKRLAEATGGRYFREESLHELPAAVTPALVPVSRREETLLWNTTAMLLLIALFTAEWVLRKVFSLS